MNLFDSNAFENVGLNADWSCSAIYASPGTPGESVRSIYVLDNLDLSGGDGPAYSFVERTVDLDNDVDEVVDLGVTDDEELVRRLVAQLRAEPDADARVATVYKALAA